MRIYVRLNQHSRPLAVEVEPSLSIGDLRQKTGAEALFLAVRSGGARFSGLPLPSSVSLIEPLDDEVLVTSAVPPHATLTAGKRPFHRSSYLSGARDAEDCLEIGSSCGQWSVKRNPTPLVSSGVQSARGNLEKRSGRQSPAAEVAGLLRDQARMREFQGELAAVKAEDFSNSLSPGIGAFHAGTAPAMGGDPYSAPAIQVSYLPEETFRPEQHDVSPVQHAEVLELSSPEYFNAEQGDTSLHEFPEEMPSMIGQYGQREANTLGGLASAMGNEDLAPAMIDSFNSSYSYLPGSPESNRTAPAVMQRQVGEEQRSGYDEYALSAMLFPPDEMLSISAPLQLLPEHRRDVGPPTPQETVPASEEISFQELCAELCVDMYRDVSAERPAEGLPLSLAARSSEPSRGPSLFEQSLREEKGELPLDQGRPSTAPAPTPAEHVRFVPRGLSLLEQTLQEQQKVRREMFREAEEKIKFRKHEEKLSEAKLPESVHEEEKLDRVLDADWEELSNVDVDPDEEWNTLNLSSELVHNALVEETARASSVNVIVERASLPVNLSRSVSVGDCDAGARQVVVAEEGVFDSLVFAWGDNSSGQCLVGDSRGSVPAPEHIPLHCLCTSLCCGSRCSILVTKRGTLWGGGYNAGGTLSEDCVDGALSKPTYVNLAELENFDFAAVAASCEHVLALTDNGVLLSWAASNMDGQAGVGSELAKASPVLPRTLAWPPQPGPAPLRNTVRVATIACGNSHSLALTDGGEVYAFGSNAKGQLGLGEKVQKSMEPAVVGGKARSIPFRAIAAGMDHSMALTVSGATFAWGSNDRGCLGLGPSKRESAVVCLPAMVPGLPGPGRYIAAGGSHSAVIVFKGTLFLAGDNSCGQLGRQMSEVSWSCDFLELPECFGLCSRNVALGEEHSLLLTYNGELHAFGRNAEGQCGLVGSHGEECVERPVRVWLPTSDTDRPLAIWSVAAGRHHNMVLCSGDPDEGNDEVWAADSPSPTKRHQVRRLTADHLPGRGWDAHGCFVPVSPRAASDAVKTTTVSSSIRPLTMPGSVPCSFMVLTISWLNSLLAATNPTVQTEMRGILAAVFARPSVLNACFCYPGVRTARLDAAGLCKALAVLCTRLEGLAQQLLEAAYEGLQTLSNGVVEDIAQRDQVRALAVYLCLPIQRAAPQPTGRSSKPTLSAKIAHVVMRMTATGRGAFRDLLADECGDMRVLRDFLVPQVRALADDAIRHVGQQPWLSGPLWEVVAQLQLQRALWQAVLLLQVLASACEQAILLLQPDKTTFRAGGAVVSRESSSSGSVVFGSSGGAGPLTNSGNLVGAHRATHPGRLALLDYTSFELVSLAEGCIPPELEFWLFQEHAQFHQITPTEVVEEPLWSDAAGMLPHRFCSFMAHANLAPIAFKQRVLQVENVLRQRLSQEQVLWPQAAMVLGGGRADPAAFYFMLSVSRQHLLRDTFAQMYSASPVELRRPLRVEFVGEEAIDEGGVMREFFRLLSAELFAPTAGLFVECEESRRLWFSPKLGPGRQLEDYWMVGVIVALAVYNNHPGMDVPLPSALFKKLKDQPTSAEDLAQLLPSHARSLEVILAWEPTQPVAETCMDMADREFHDTFCMSYCFSANDDTPEVPLCEGGLDRPVLFSDREEFAACVHDHLLHKSVQPQFESFARGFRRVCNSPLFDVLSPLELEAIVAGDKDLDMSRLQQGVQYEGYMADEPYMQSFWSVLESFSVLRRRRFLAFCTGSDVAPAGGLQDLHLLIQKHGSEPTMRLPVAHTCFNLLLLPHYSSVEKLSMMLVTAIEWTEGFGLQ